MAVTGSGTITFANLQTEFGGSHPITMGEYSAHRISGSGNTISLNQFYGAAATWTATMTIGAQSAKPGTRYGSIPGSGFGSISDSTVDTLSNATISALHTNFSGAGIILTWSGSLVSGWTSITIGSNTINKSSFSTYGNTYQISSGSYIATSGTQTIAFNI